MTRTVPIGAAALLALLVPFAGAQEPPPLTRPPLPPMCGGDETGPRTLVHLDGVGAATSMSATRHGDAWKIELERQALADEEGNASEQRMVLVVKATPEVDQGLDALFREAPQEPAEWERRLEEIAHVDIDFEQAAPVWRETSPPSPGEEIEWRARRVLQELRRTWLELRAEIKDELRRWRDEHHGRCHDEKDRPVRDEDRLYR